MVEPANINSQFFQTLKEEIIPLLLKLLQKNEEEGKHPNSSTEGNFTLIPKPEKKMLRKETMNL